MPTMVWSIENPAAALALETIFWAGWGMVLLSTFLINHFELFGLSQSMSRRSDPAAPVFRTPLF